MTPEEFAGKVKESLESRDTVSYLRAILKQDEEYLALNTRRMEQTPTIAFKEHCAYLDGRVHAYKEIIWFLTQQVG